MRRAVKRLLSRYRKWKEWRIYTTLGKFEQFMTLLGINRNMHFEFFYTNSCMNNDSRRMENENQA